MALSEAKPSECFAIELTQIEGIVVHRTTLLGKWIIDLTTSRRGFGMIVFIHPVHHREVSLSILRIRLKKMVLLLYTKREHTSNSSGFGERTEDDSVGILVLITQESSEHL